MIDAELAPELYEHLGYLIKQERGIPLEINGMPDHVHLLVKLRPDHNVSEIMRDVKSCSTGWAHRTREHLQHFGWQTGYGAFTVSHSQVERVRAYIRNQQAHHANMALDQEYLALCRKHGIPADEETLWQ